MKIDCSSLLMDRYSPRRSLYSGPNSFVDSDEVSPEIGLQNAESFYGSAGGSSSRICHIYRYVTRDGIQCCMCSNIQ